jgi:hypothetical protein
MIQDTVFVTEQLIESLCYFTANFLAHANIFCTDSTIIWKNSAVQEDGLIDRNLHLPQIHHILQGLQAGHPLPTHETIEPVFFKINCVFAVNERALDHAHKYFHMRMQFFV